MARENQARTRFFVIRIGYRAERVSYETIFPSVFMTALESGNQFGRIRNLV